MDEYPPQVPEVPYQEGARRSSQSDEARSTRSDDGRCCSRDHLAVPRRGRSTRRRYGHITGDDLGAEAYADICVEIASEPRPHKKAFSSEQLDYGS